MNKLIRSEKEPTKTRKVTLSLYVDSLATDWNCPGIAAKTFFGEVVVGPSINYVH